MIQRLKSLKKFDIVFAVSTLIALIVASIALGRSSKRSEYLQSLTELREKSIYNDDLLKKQLTDLGYALGEGDSSANQNGLFEDYSLKSMDEIIEILAEYPSDYDTAIHYDGAYSVGFGFPLFGMDEWERFIANCRLGRPGYIVMTQFSANFVGTYYYIEYDGKRYHVVEDRSRDFDGGGTGYAEAYGRYLRVENYPTDAGFAEYAFLTDDATMTYKKAQDYYLNDSEDITKEPSCWDFYIGVYTDEIINNLVRESNRISSTFKSDYTGFLDRHPDYMEDNLRIDYDGDGLLDRVYREHLVFEDGKFQNSAYLMFGNGECLTLCKDMAGDACKTILADLDFDGDADISFIDYSDKLGSERAYLYVFENKNGHYTPVTLPENEAKRIEMIVAESDGNNIFKFVVGEEEETEYYVRYRYEKWMVQR